MGTFSIWHWLVVLAVVLLLFGGKDKISNLMGDFGKGIKNFKKGLKDGESAEGGQGEDAKVLKSESGAEVDATKSDQAAKS